MKIQLSYRMKRISKNLISYIILIIISLFFIFPLIWSLISSFKPRTEMVKSPPSVFPEQFTIENYVDLFVVGKITRNFLNSFIIAMSVAIITIIVAGLAAYRLSRAFIKITERIKRPLYATYMFPPIMLALSLVKIFAMMGIYNSRLGVTLAHLTTTLPYATLLLWPFFSSIPRELDEAALIDGASRPRIFVSIILPAALPGVISIGVFSFIMSWNDFTYAFFLVRTNELKTAPLRISDFMLQEAAFPWKWVLPSIVIMALPTLIIYILLEEKLIKGFGAIG